MPKVKIIFCEEISPCDEFSGIEILRESLTDWEEITDEEYKDLLKDRYHYEAFRDINNRGNTKIFVIDQVPVAERIKSIRELIAKENEKLKKYKEKQQADEKRRAKDRKARKAAKEKKLLEDLAKKHGIDLAKIKDTNETKR